MKKTLLLAAAAMMFPGVELFACGPYFPASYFSSIGVDAPERDIYDSPDPASELKLIGEHYYPAWKGKNPKRSPTKGPQSDSIDIRKAVPGIEQSEIQKFGEFVKVCDDASKPLPAMPEKSRIPLEFRLYALGRGRFLRDPSSGTPPEWTRLLALPAAERKYRTVRVYCALTLAAPDFAGTETYLAKMRAALDSGFADTAGLEEAVLRHLVRRDRVSGLRWLPLLLAAGPEKEFRESVLRDLERWQKVDWEKSQPFFFSLMEKDRVGREILASVSPETAAEFRPVEGSALLTADRQAWRAFECGKFELAEKLLALAPEDSPVALFTRARLARMKDDYEKSAKLLKRWIEVTDKAPSADPMPGIRFRISGTCEEYQIDRADVPAGHYIHGMLGTVLVERKDYAEALRCFLEAGAWHDAAAAAEQHMTPEELGKFVKAHRSLPLMDKLSYLTARMMMRKKKIAEAGEFFPESMKQYYAIYVEQSRIANDPAKPKNERALALLNLSRLLASKGMELTGTELNPDCFLYDGAYQGSDPQENCRFHYRYVSMNYALRAAAMAEDPAIADSSLLFGFAVSFSLGHNKYRDETFYHLLCDRAPRKSHWIPGKLRKEVVRRLWTPEVLKSADPLKDLKLE